MSMTPVGESALVHDSGGTASISYSPTAGNAVFVFIAQTAAASRSYSVSDNIDGATGWTQLGFFAPGQRVEIWGKANLPSGVTTINVSANSDTTFRVAALEVSGMGTALTVDASDTLAEGSSTANHTCSATGVSSANEVIALCAAALATPATECNPGSGYTEVPNGETNNQTLFQYQVFPSGATNEVGAWTSTGSQRAGRSVIVLVSGNASGGSGISASLNATEADDSIVASATVEVKASVAASEADDTAVATATVLVQASLAANEAADSLTATATVTDPVSGISATVSVTEDNDSAVGTATVLVQATTTVSEADDSVAATAGVRVSASVGISEDADTGVATATVLISASLAATEGNDSLTATAAVLGPISATLSVIEADDTVQASARQMSGLNPTFVLTLGAERRRVIYVEGGKREVVLDGAPRSVYV